MVFPRRNSRWNMQRPCATCSYNSVHVASASSSQAVTTASVVGTAKTALEKSSASLRSLHPVRVSFFSRGVQMMCESLCLAHHISTVSGGGFNFSFHFPRPDYQKNAVPVFFQQFGTQYDGMYEYVRCCDLTGSIPTL